MEERKLKEEIDEINNENNGLMKKINSLKKQIENLIDEENFIKNQLMNLEKNNYQAVDAKNILSDKKTNNFDIEENKLQNSIKNNFEELNSFVKSSVSKKCNVEFTMSRVSKLPTSLLCVKSLKFEESFLNQLDIQSGTIR